MSRKSSSKGSLVYQTTKALSAKDQKGQSKHAAKQNGTAKDGIYSSSTMRSYMKHSNKFVRWARSVHGVSTLAEARPYASEWLQHEADRGLSASSIKLERSALAKLYGIPGSELGATPPRSRATITRSRGAAIRDAGFSRENNVVCVAAAECAGTRRNELRLLTGDKLISRPDGSYAVLLDRGTKGGRARIAPVVGPPEQVQTFIQAMKAAGSGRLLPGGVPSHADIHAMRGTYACRVYQQHARPIEEIKNQAWWDKDKKNGPGQRRGGYVSAVYHCRGDLKGLQLDKEAMRVTSEALGHGRISVIAGHYLYQLQT